MSLKASLVNQILGFLTWILCRVDKSQLDQVPAKGPLILISNHINFLEVPVIVPRLMPRNITAFIKLQSFDNLLFNFLFTTWGGIPIRRGEADLDAFKKGLDALQAEKILVISPEGTRSNDGKLKKGFPGVVLMAVRSGAPILPLAHYGGEEFWPNFKRLKRTDFITIVGNPFRVNLKGQALTRELRQEITDEIMVQLAALLPPRYRGYYSDFENASEDYLEFEPGVESNLQREKNRVNQKNETE